MGFYDIWERLKFETVQIKNEINMYVILVSVDGTHENLTFLLNKYWFYWKSDFLSDDKNTCQYFCYNIGNLKTKDFLNIQLFKVKQNISDWQCGKVMAQNSPQETSKEGKKSSF